MDEKEATDEYDATVEQEEKVSIFSHFYTKVCFLKISCYSLLV